jgi:hypothetical protein|tara:strand:- start:1990 stop:2631 length:642 start_codon:yes stop_codon:yes gene_type:complete
MGYRTSYLNWMNEHIAPTFPNVSGLKMLELGNQVIKPDKRIPETTGKAYYTRLGYEHTSVDLNGLDGALVKDLSNLEHFTEFQNYFDVITNAGTIEHVEPYESQHTAFLNVHNSLKTGGIAIHIGPELGTTKPGHCQYYYDLPFWDNITEHSDYDFLGTCVLSRWRLYAVKKTGDKFIDAENLHSKIHRVTGPKGGMYIDGKDKKAQNRLNKK